MWTQHSHICIMLDRIMAAAKTGQLMAEEETGEDFGDTFASADRGQMGAMRVVSLIVALTVGAIVAAFLLPIGLSELSGSSLGDNASSGATALWGILDVIIVLAVFLFFIAIALRATDRV